MEEKWEKAEELLVKKVKETQIEDAVYELAFEKVGDLIKEVEKELGIDEDEDDDGTRWYDELREEMMSMIYDKVRDFLEGMN